MRLLSPQISQFLKKLDLDQRRNITMVPKSDSAGNPGDIVIFRYIRGLKQRAAMLVQPIAKDARTGNLLLTVVLIDPNEYETVEQLRNLYTNRGSLPENSYRTFIMSRITGPLLRMVI